MTTTGRGVIPDVDCAGGGIVALELADQAGLAHAGIRDEQYVLHPVGTRLGERLLQAVEDADRGRMRDPALRPDAGANSEKSSAKNSPAIR